MTFTIHPHLISIFNFQSLNLLCGHTFKSYVLVSIQVIDLWIEV